MRLSTSLFYKTGVQTLTAQNNNLMHLYQQVGKNRRMVTPADDPLAAAQAINVRQAQALNDRYAANRSVLESNLGAQDNALSSAVDLMAELKSRLVEAGNGTMADADRASLATVLSSMRDTLMGIANSQDGNGLYLFSGHNSSQPAFDESTGVYNGQSGMRMIQADATRQIASNDLGSTVFAKAPSGSLACVSEAGGANTGSGRMSGPVLFDNQMAGCDFSITFQDATHYDVTVNDGGTISTYSGVYDPASGTIPLTLDGNPGSSKIIEVSFSGAPSANDSFTVKPADSSGIDMCVFKTMDDLIAALKTPTTNDPAAGARLANVLSTAMQKIDQNYDQLLTVRASVGTRMNEVSSLNTTGSQRALGYSQRLSDLEDLDLYTVSTQLQLRTATLQAAMDAFKLIQSTGLTASAIR
jgi:flagellar hook-associated protein 3 FlgL